MVVGAIPFNPERPAALTVPREIIRSEQPLEPPAHYRWNSPEIKARIFCGDSFVPIDPDTVVEGLERQFPREWLEQVSIRRKESVRVEKKRGFMDRLAEVKW